MGGILLQRLAKEVSKKKKKEVLWWLSAKWSIFKALDAQQYCVYLGEQKIQC